MHIETLGVGDEDRLRAIGLRAPSEAPRALASTHDEVAARLPARWTQQLRDLDDPAECAEPVATRDTH